VLASIRSAAVLGIAAYDVTVDAEDGLPEWMIVGLALSAVKEVHVLISSALNISGFALLSSRITINLSPDKDAKEQTIA
jgi:predicted ATPase with chaperone activity